jgi:hypothetical protein
MRLPAHPSNYSGRQGLEYLGRMKGWIARDLYRSRPSSLETFIARDLQNNKAGTRLRPRGCLGHCADWRTQVLEPRMPVLLNQTGSKPSEFDA